MKIAGRLWLALALIAALMAVGCSSEDGGTTDPLPNPIPPGDYRVYPDSTGSMAPLSAVVQVATAGQTIVVMPGTYSGTLVVDKPLTFTSGAGKDNTILTNETDTTTVLVQISGSYASGDSLIFLGLGFNSGGRGLVVESSTVPIAMRESDILDNALSGIQIGDATGKAGGDPSLSLWQCFFRRNGRSATTIEEGAALWSSSTVVANSIFFDHNRVDIAITSAGLADITRMTAATTDSVSIYLDNGSEMTLEGISPDIPTTLRDGIGWAARIINSSLTVSNFTVQRFDAGAFDVRGGTLVLDTVELSAVERYAVRSTNAAVTIRDTQILDVAGGDRSDAVPNQHGYAVWAQSTDGGTHPLLVQDSTIQNSFRAGIQATGLGQMVTVESSGLLGNGVGWSGLTPPPVNDPNQPLGGGLGVFDHATAVLTGAQVSLNYGVRGGGVAVIGVGASVSISGGELRANQAGLLGAGILVQGAIGTITDCRLLSNNSKGYGGGAAVTEGGRLDFDNTPLQSNIANGGGGGAYIFRGQASFANNSNFISNASVRSSPTQPNGLGGGLYLSQADVALDGTTFQQNTGDLGGALYATTLDRDAVVSDCIFVGNRSAVNAAAVYTRDLTRELTLERCQLYNNELTVPTNTVPSTIYSRQDLPGGRLVITGCTIAYNRNGSGVIGHESGEMSITESVVAFNIPAGLVGKDLPFVDMSCNDFWNNGSLDYGPGANPGPGSISADPLFCDAANAVYTVDSSSPLLPANNTCGVQMGARGQGCAAKQ